jgi:SAM-dependent methyltransferase
MSITLLRRATMSFRNLGLRRSIETLGNHFSDLWFDLRNGTDTYKRVAQSELTVDSANQAQAAPYFPTRGRSFLKALEAFQVPKEGTLVDLGSGKGKILLLAAQKGFRRVRGIEFSPDLARIAVTNAQRMKGNLGNAEVETLCIDVTTYSFSPDETVFFMFAPFGPDVMRQTMVNLQESLDEHPRRIWIVYTLPRLIDVVTTHLSVTPQATFAHGGHDFVLLTN